MTSNLLEETDEKNGASLRRRIVIICHLAKKN